jgi:plastocyanin
VRRTLSLILFVVMLAGLLSACGNDNDTSNTDLGATPDTTSSDGGHGEMDHGANTPVAPGARPIDVTGSSYEFEPGEITIQAGEDVAIVLTATDIQHDFTIVATTPSTNEPVRLIAQVVQGNAATETGAAKVSS